MPKRQYQTYEELQAENARLRAACRINAIRDHPELSHAEIDAEIERIMRGDEQKANESGHKRFIWPIEKCSACGGEPRPGCVNIGCPYPFDEAHEQREPRQTSSKPSSCVDDEPNTCTQPFNWDDGVPYCDTCGLYRQSVHHKQSEKGGT